MWGIDILGPFPLAIRQMKYLVVAIEYFTKWIEVEPVAQITAHKIQSFVWKNIVCRFGVPSVWYQIMGLSSQVTCEEAV